MSFNKVSKTGAKKESRNGEISKISESTKKLIMFLNAIYFVFSGDESPLGKSKFMDELERKHNVKVIYINTMEEEGPKLFDECGINTSFLDACGKFILGILKNVNKCTYKLFPKHYKEYHSKLYPFLSKFCVFLPPTKEGEPSNVELHLRSHFKYDILVSDILHCVPGTHELGIKHDVLIKELGHLTNEQRQYLLYNGIYMFITKYPNILCGGVRSIWPEPPTVWNKGKDVKVFLGNFLKEKLTEIVHHKTIPICSCGKSTSNIRGFIKHLVDKNDSIIVDDSDKRMEKTPTPKEYKKFMAIICDCKNHIKWSNLSTKYFQTFSEKVFLESLYVKLQEKASKYYDPKQCVMCLEEILYENQRIDGCSTKHPNCICDVCYNAKLTQQINIENGDLVLAHLYKCIICHKYHDTYLGRYFKNVPEDHQTRCCTDCRDLFHAKPDCGGEDISIYCPDCLDKKEKKRPFVDCPWCSTPIQRDHGCDLVVCGRHYDGSNIIIDGQILNHGCGKAFCYGCLEKFIDKVLVDWTCACFITGSIPKEYNPSAINKSMCKEKYLVKEREYFFRKWQLYMEDNLVMIRSLVIR